MGSEEGPKRPPLQPKIIESRVSAQSSRPQETASHSPISWTTVVDAVAQELGKTQEHLPKKLWRFSRIRAGVHVVGLASTNTIREEDFRRRVNLPLRRIVGDEDHSGDSLIDARSKALNAAAIDRQQRRQAWRHDFRQQLRLRLRDKPESWGANPWNGLDAVNVIPQVENGVVKFVQLGKPERIDPGNELPALQQRFAALSQMAADNNWPGIPLIVEMTHYIRNVNGKGKYDGYSRKQKVIVLVPKIVAHVATDAGFAEYQRLAQDSYPALEKTAGGIKIETFKNMNGVVFITDKPDELQTMNWNPDNQEAEYEQTVRLAKGMFNQDFFSAYTDKFPPTLRQRWDRIRRRLNG